MGRRSSVPVRGFKNLVQESWNKGLTVEKIVDHLRSKNRECVRLKRQILMIKVREIVKSLSNDDGKEEEESNGSTKRKRRDDHEPRTLSFNTSSGTDELESTLATSDSSSGNVTTSDDDTQFDMTSDSLCASYSKKSTTLSTPSFVETTKKKVTSSEEGSKGYHVEVNGPTFKDLGGLKGVLDELNRYVKLPLLCPDIVQGLRIRPLTGLLLHGPPGCGKSTLACAIANETGVPFYMLSAPELVTGVSGGSEENIRELFAKACRTAPSIIFIDEIDAIGSKRENQQKGMDTRIVTQLLNCMEVKYMRQKMNESKFSSDDLSSKPGHVIVIGATNRPDSLDMALRRRFKKEIYLGVADEKAREEIISSLTRNLPLESTFDSARIARLTPGFVGSDLEDLVMEAGMIAAYRTIDSRKSEFCTDIDILMRQKISEEEEKKLFHATSDYEVR